MLPEVEKKVSYEEYNKFLALTSNLTCLLDKIGFTHEAKAVSDFLKGTATKLEKYIGE